MSAEAELERLRGDFATAVQRAGQAKADAERKVASVLDRTEVEVEQLQAELAEARATIERVRALHSPSKRMPDMCKECNHVPAADCPTLRALDIPAPPPATVTKGRESSKGPRKPKAMYRLVRTTPEGVEKQGSPVRRIRDAATSAALVLTDNLNAPKPDAQRFAALLDRTPVGDSVRHESGYVFRVEEVAAS